MARSTFEIFQLRCFLAVAEELNFRRAATRLNMTQPPLSRQIRLLEENVGLILLERTNRSVTLTPAGESFLKSAYDILQRAEHAVWQARQAARGQAGAVTMGFVPSATFEIVPRILTALKRELSAVIFTPVEMLSHEISEALVTQRIDLGLTRTTDRGRQIESIRIVHEPFVLAVPAGHLLSQRGRLEVVDLEGTDFIGYSSERGGYLGEIHHALFTTAGVSPKVVQEVSQTQSVLSLVNVGLGVALVPRSATAMRMENLRYVPVDIPEQFNPTIYLNYLQGGENPLHKQVRSVILKQFPDADLETAP